MPGMGREMGKGKGGGDDNGGRQRGARFRFERGDGEIDIRCDEESGLIRQAEMGSADLHDSQMGAGPIQGDEDAYYADSETVDGLVTRVASGGGSPYTRD